jgi:hypothetical protein
MSTAAPHALRAHGVRQWLLRLALPTGEPKGDSEHYEAIEQSRRLIEAK